MYQEHSVNTTIELVELIQLLQDVEMDTPEAKLNEFSMTDANGNRIKY